jgi:hypothetical protein
MSRYGVSVIAASPTRATLTDGHRCSRTSLLGALLLSGPASPGNTRSSGRSFPPTVCAVPPSCRRLCGCHPPVVDVDAYGCGTDRRSPRFSPRPVGTARRACVRWTLVRTGAERATAHQGRPRSPRFSPGRRGRRPPVVVLWCGQVPRGDFDRWLQHPLGSPFPSSAAVRLKGRES